MATKLEELKKRAREIWGRSRDEVLLNTPIRVTVGGCHQERPDNVKEVAIREPSNKRFRDHAMLIIDALKVMIDTNWEWVKKLWENPAIFTAADVYRFGPVITNLGELVADIVGEDVTYVDEDMGPEQTAEVLTAYVKALGLKRIKELFSTARLEWQGLVPEASEVQPSQPQERPAPTLGGQSVSENGPAPQRPSTEARSKITLGATPERLQPSASPPAGAGSG